MISNASLSGTAATQAKQSGGVMNNRWWCLSIDTQKCEYSCESSRVLSRFGPLVEIEVHKGDYIVLEWPDGSVCGEAKSDESGLLWVGPVRVVDCNFNRINIIPHTERSTWEQWFIDGPTVGDIVVTKNKTVYICVHEAHSVGQYVPALWQQLKYTTEWALMLVSKQMFIDPTDVDRAHPNAAVRELFEA